VRFWVPSNWKLNHISIILYEQTFPILVHLNAVHSEKRNFSCSSCSKSFKTNGDLKQHFSSVHDKKIRFNCDVCQKGFYRKSDHQIHQNIHRDKNNQTRLSCYFCGQTLSKVGHSFVNHMRSHTREKPFICESQNCGYASAHWSGV